MFLYKLCLKESWLRSTYNSSWASSSFDDTWLHVEDEWRGKIGGPNNGHSWIGHDWVLLEPGHGGWDMHGGEGG